MITFSVGSTKTIATTTQRLVRPATSGDRVVADSDMSSVWVRHPGSNKFVPLVQASHPPSMAALPGVIARPICSRVYLPSIAGDVVCMKLGVKEVEDSGTPFDKTHWGMYLVRFNPDNTVKWHGRYPIHKGNAQVVTDPKDSTVVLLIASTGIAWRIRLTDGAITQKSTFVMGASGEKNRAKSNAQLVQTGFVGYTDHPSGMARVGVDSKSIGWMSKPPYNEIGDDMTYCDIQSASGQPKGLWAAVVVGGQLLYNFVAPRSSAPKWPMTALPSAGPADKLPRFAPSLFPLMGNKKTVGVAFTDNGRVYVQDLQDRASRKEVGVGSWPVAVVSGGTVKIRYFAGNEMKESTVRYA